MANPPSLGRCLRRATRFPLLLVPVIVVTLAYAEDEEKPSEIDWGPYGVSRIFAATRVAEDDADGVTLRGLILGYGVRDQSGECNCGHCDPSPHRHLSGIGSGLPLLKWARRYSRIL